jgi:hypothetical protein
MEPGDVNLDAEILKIQKITVGSEFMKNIEKIYNNFIDSRSFTVRPQKINKWNSTLAILYIPCKFLGLNGLRVSPQPGTHMETPSFNTRYR